MREEVKEDGTTVCYFPELEYRIRENKLPILEPIINAITSIIPKQ